MTTSRNERSHPRRIPRTEAERAHHRGRPDSVPNETCKVIHPVSLLLKKQKRTFPRPTPLRLRVFDLFVALVPGLVPCRS